MFTVQCYGLLLALTFDVKEASVSAAFQTTLAVVQVATLPWAAVEVRFLWVDTCRSRKYYFMPSPSNRRPGYRAFPLPVPSDLCD